MSEWRRFAKGGRWVLIDLDGRKFFANARLGKARPNPSNPDRLFLVQHEGQALDAIERFGDAPCVLAFELVP